MKVIDKGHSFLLNQLDSREMDYPVQIRFVKREGKKYPGNKGSYPGTNFQEVLRALISRLIYVNNQRHCRKNKIILKLWRRSLVELDTRAAQNHGRKTPIFTKKPESMKFCEKCGHIGCKGECHK